MAMRHQATLTSAGAPSLPTIDDEGEREAERDAVDMSITSDATLNVASSAVKEVSVSV